MVVGVGEAATADGLAPAEKFGDSELFAQAEEALGGDFKPSFLISMPDLVKRGRRVRPGRSRLGQGEALPRGVHGDRQRRTFEDDELGSRVVAGVK